jgi:hypothetical protein
MKQLWVVLLGNAVGSVLDGDVCSFVVRDVASVLNDNVGSGVGRSRGQRCVVVKKGRDVRSICGTVNFMDWVGGLWTG